MAPVGVLGPYPPITYTFERAKLPKGRKKAPAIPVATQKEIRRYETAYRSCFKRFPAIEYTAPFIRIDGKEGVNVKRLKQLTAQLRERVRNLV